MGAEAHNERTQTKRLQRLESARRVVLTWTGTKRRGRRRRRRQRALLLFIESHHQRPGPTPSDSRAHPGRGGGPRPRGPRAVPIIVLDVTGFVSAAPGVEEISMQTRSPPRRRTTPNRRPSDGSGLIASFCTCIAHSASIALLAILKCHPTRRCDEMARPCCAGDGHAAHGLAHGEGHAWMTPLPWILRFHISNPPSLPGCPAEPASSLPATESESGVPARAGWDLPMLGQASVGPARSPEREGTPAKPRFSHLHKFPASLDPASMDPRLA